MVQRRGRPRRNVISTDQAIAKTAEQLIMWGFSGRGQVFEAVGIAARKVLNRMFSGSGMNTSLGPDRIEQIWEKYRPPGWERYWPEDMRRLAKPIVKRRWLYTKRGLQQRVPDKTKNVQELAEILLRNGGSWPWPTERVWLPLERKWEEQEIYDAPTGDLQLSPKWSHQLEFGPKLRLRRK